MASNSIYNEHPRGTNDPHFDRKLDSVIGPREFFNATNSMLIEKNFHFLQVYHESNRRRKELH